MKKKLLFIVSMLAVTFMFAGCSFSSDSDVGFEYDEQEIAQVATDLCETYMGYAEQDEYYNYLVEAGEDNGIDESEIEAVEAFRNIGDQCGDFEEFTGEYKISETDGSVLVTLYATCTEKEALIKVSFEDNSAVYDLQKYQLVNQYGYTDDEVAEYMESSMVYPYKMSDIEIAANMTFEDKMAAAGTHTLIGMGTVFLVLIFISFIIYLLRFVPGLFDKSKRAEKKQKKQSAEETKEQKTETKTEMKTETPAERIVDIVNTQTGESVMNDAQLVAVMTAAVTAYGAGASSGTEPAAGSYVEEVTYPSKDTLVARKIRRIKR